MSAVSLIKIRRVLFKILCQQCSHALPSKYCTSALGALIQYLFPVTFNLHVTLALYRLFLLTYLLTYLHAWTHEQTRNIMLPVTLRGAKT